jgi:hypothetical protein
VASTNDICDEFDSKETAAWTVIISAENVDIVLTVSARNMTAMTAERNLREVDLWDLSYL